MATAAVSRTGMTITRTPTLISMHQEDTSPAPMTIGTACATKESRPILPLLEVAARRTIQQKKLRSFGSFSDLQVPDIDGNSSPSSEGSEGANEERSKFDSLLLSQWEDKFDLGLFRYDVTACSTKILSGHFGFVAQLNEGRATKKRPTEFSIDKVCQPFDSNKFNFTKADCSEVLFQFEPVYKKQNSEYLQEAKIGENPNVILINVSPIEYGHVLLVPAIADKLPQQLNPDHCLLALQMAHEAQNPYFRVGYNSLGAYATINHLHFQAYYLAAPFPIERAPTVAVPGMPKRKRNRIQVSATADYPVRAFVFELRNSLEELADAVGSICEKMQERNIPFNVLIADSGCRVFLIPNMFSTRMAQGEVPEKVVSTGVNPAVFEISGHLLYKQKSDYDEATEQEAFELLAPASLSEVEFSKLAVSLLGEEGL